MRHPKIIHRIWLGPNQPHPDDIAFTSAWADMYSDWEVIVWDDELVDRELRPNMILGGPYDHSPTYVHRADIVTVEAIHQIGGMLVDFDVEPVRPLIPLIDHLKGWTIRDTPDGPGGAIFGAAPGHRAIAAIIAAIAARYPTWRGRPHLDTGPHPWREALPPTRMLGLTPIKSYRAAYPVDYRDRAILEDPRIIAKLKADPDVYAIHYYRGSWVKGSGIDVTVRDSPP